MKTRLTKHERRLVQKIKSMEDLAKIAALVIQRMQPPVAMVSGPISTGGKGSIAANMRAMRKTIDDLSGKSVKVFDQTIFEPQMKKIAKAHPEYLTDEVKLLEEFYLPLLEKELVGLICFMPDWKSSFGARWEHKQARRLKIEIMYL